MISISEKEFKQLSSYIKSNFGINLKPEKQMLVSNRLQNILIQNGFNNFSEYYEYVINDKTGDAITALVNRITTNHTFFMREEDHFYYFRDKVLPYLETNVKDRDLRIWSAGCSTGEEPYTLAIIIDEFFGKEKFRWDTKVLATDISLRVLEEAKNGLYSNEKIGTLPMGWRQKYFTKLDIDSSIVSNRIRNEVIFRKYNLMERTFSFKKKFHVIFCRNVMIYFDLQTKRELIRKFYDSLEQGGLLFIGHSETVMDEESRFIPVIPAVYRKE